MSAYAYILKKSSPIKTTINGESVKVYNLKYLCKHRQLDPMNWWSKEDKREGALFNARAERASSNTFDNEEIFFAIDIQNYGQGESVKIYRGKTEEVKTWVDWGPVPGNLVGSVTVSEGKRKKYIFTPHQETKEITR